MKITDDELIRSDMRMVRRACNEGWPIPEIIRSWLTKQLRRIAKSRQRRNRDRQKADEALAALREMHMNSQR